MNTINVSVKINLILQFDFKKNLITSYNVHHLVHLTNC